MNIADNDSIESGLQRLIARSDDPVSVLRQTCDIYPMPKLVDYMRELIARSHYTERELFELIALERTAGFRILSEERKPSRNVLLRIALQLSLSAEKTQDLLYVGQRTALSPRVRRDVLLLYALSHHIGCAAAEELLTRFGEEGLYRSGKQG